MLDFSNLSQYKENIWLEAKKAQGGLPHSIWETYSAFANTCGGVILLGVIEQKDKSFASVPLRDVQWLMDEFWRSVSDPAVVSANILTQQNVCIEESDGNRILVIEVPRAPARYRPVYIGTDPYTGSYYRSGEADLRMERKQVEELLRAAKTEKRK